MTKRDRKPLPIFGVAPCPSSETPFSENWWPQGVTPTSGPHTLGGPWPLGGLGGKSHAQTLTLTLTLTLDPHSSSTDYLTRPGPRPSELCFVGIDDCSSTFTFVIETNVMYCFMNVYVCFVLSKLFSHRT